MIAKYDITEKVIGPKAALEHASLLEAIRREVEELMMVGTVPLSQLACRMLLTRGHLNRKVKAATGITLQQLVTAMKLDHATELLKHSTALKIHEVATLSGFDSAVSFTRAFHRTAGCSPTQYRNNEIL